MSGESKDDSRAKATEDLAFDELHYAQHEDMKFFQDLLNNTYKDSLPIIVDQPTS